jgi:hypothetical protein
MISEEHYAEGDENTSCSAHQEVLATNSVVDPCIFGTDPDPRIHTTDLRIRIRFWILLFSSVADKMPTNNKVFLFKDILNITVLIEGSFTSFFIDKKSKSLKIVETKFFLLFWLVDGRIQVRIRKYTDTVWIHGTGINVVTFISLSYIRQKFGVF